MTTASHGSPAREETRTYTTPPYQELNTTVPVKLMARMHFESKKAGVSLGAWVRMTLWAAVDEAREKEHAES